MKRHTVVVQLVLLSGLLVACFTPAYGGATGESALTSAPQNSSADDSVLQLVQTWLNAEADGDTTALDKLLADDFIGTGPGGNILNKSDIVPPAGTERPKMPKSRVKESSVRLFGNTAVVMGSVAYETLNQPGFRFTLVFLNRGQRWQMIAAHLASAPAK